MANCALRRTEALVRNDFEFGFLKAHDWGIVGAVIVALAMIAFPLIALHEFSPWQTLALGLAFVAPNARKFFSKTLSSPAEQADAQRAEECEGKGTQVETQAHPPRIDHRKPRKPEQAATPGSPSLTRAKDSEPAMKQRAARARRG
jgi:hypothetical protein